MAVIPLNGLALMVYAPGPHLLLTEHYCYAMLCYAMLCCAMLCYAVLCYAIYILYNMHNAYVMLEN